MANNLYIYLYIRSWLIKNKDDLENEDEVKNEDNHQTKLISQGGATIEIRFKVQCAFKLNTFDSKSCLVKKFK